MCYIFSNLNKRLIGQHTHSHKVFWNLSWNVQCVMCRTRWLYSLTFRQKWKKKDKRRKQFLTPLFITLLVLKDWLSGRCDGKYDRFVTIPQSSIQFALKRKAGEKIKAPNNMKYRKLFETEIKKWKFTVCVYMNYVLDVLRRTYISIIIHNSLRFSYTQRAVHIVYIHIVIVFNVSLFSFLLIVQSFNS